MVRTPRSPLSCTSLHSGEPRASDDGCDVFVPVATVDFSGQPFVGRGVPSGPGVDRKDEGIKLGDTFSQELPLGTPSFSAPSSRIICPVAEFPLCGSQTRRQHPSGTPWMTRVQPSLVPDRGLNTQSPTGLHVPASKSCAVGPATPADSRCPTVSRWLVPVPTPPGPGDPGHPLCSLPSLV